MKTPFDLFVEDSEKKRALAAVLQNPELREALGILKDQLEPDADDREALVNPQIAVSERHQVAGANHIIKGLRKLATAPPAAPKPLPGHKPLVNPDQKLTEEQLKELQQKEGS